MQPAAVTQESVFFAFIPIFACEVDRSRALQMHSGGS